MTTDKHHYLVSCKYGILGSVSLNDGPRKDVNGWWFISAISSHKNGRRAWPTAEEAIPAWAKMREAELI